MELRILIVLCLVAAAEDYTFGLWQLVKAWTSDLAKNSNCPKFDLILGIGADGYLVSLFLIKKKSRLLS